MAKAILVLGILAVVLFQNVVSSTSSTSVLARADFRWDTEGWSALYKNGTEKSVESNLGQLIASDEDESAWFFVAGKSFKGDLSLGYGGTLTISIGHSEYNSLGLGIQDDFDIILDSETHQFSLGHKHVFPGWVALSQSVVELSEEGGWVRTDTGESATKLALLSVLSTLSRLRIRGGYYHGHEYTFITECVLSKGVKVNVAPWLRNDPGIDELCEHLKLPPFACEQYAVQLVTNIKQLDVASLEKQYREMMAAVDAKNSPPGVEDLPEPEAKDKEDDSSENRKLAKKEL